MSQTGKYLHPDAEKVRSLRMKRGWPVSELATKSRSSSGTIASIERGRRAQVATLARIARSLDVPINELLPDTNEPAAPITEVKAAVGTRVSFTINMNFSDLDETEWFIEYLREFSRLAAMKGRLDVDSVEPGESVIVGLTVENGDAYNAAIALIESKLSALNVVRLRMPPNPYMPVFRSNRYTIRQEWERIGRPKSGRFDIAIMAEKLRHARAHSENNPEGYPPDVESSFAAQLILALLGAGAEARIQFHIAPDGSFTIVHPDVDKPPSIPYLEKFQPKPEEESGKTGLET